eukprot:SAG22_NODE_18626_length_284_cov_0.551351_1_plen_58_part_10
MGEQPCTICALHFAELRQLRAELQNPHTGMPRFGRGGASTMADSEPARGYITNMSWLE